MPSYVFAGYNEYRARFRVQHLLGYAPEEPLLQTRIPVRGHDNGIHTVFLGSSFLAQKFAQHLGVRGDEPQRRRQLFKGETKRQRLGIPMLMGKLIE